MNVIEITIDFTKNRDSIKKLLDKLVYDINIDIYNIIFLEILFILLYWLF